MDNFLSTILPTQGVYCSFAAKDGHIRQAFHDTIEELAKAGDKNELDTYDSYYALATFNGPDGGRKQANAVFLRAFFIELDCGGEKPYTDHADAAASLRAFVDDTKLPIPTVVSSGGGLHVYWVMDRDIPLSEWTPLAVALKALCIQKALRIDAVISADSARVLRIPGTHNYKRDQPRPVTLLKTSPPSSVEAFAALLKSIVVDFSSVISRTGPDQATRDLMGGEYPETQFAKIVRRSIKGDGCAQIVRIVRDKAALEEPLWRAGLSIAVLCTDGETAIQKISEGHAGYDPETTRVKAYATKGPYTCEWFKSNYPDKCAGCTQRITSPIALGRVVAEAPVVDDAYIVHTSIEPDNEPTAVEVEVVIPKYPFPYFRGAKGGVYIKTKDKTGEPVELEIYRHDLYLTTRFYDMGRDDEGEGEMVGINLHLEHDGVRRFHSPITALFTIDKLRDLLVKHGAIAYGQQLHLIMNYFASSIRQLQSQFAANKTRNQMGWTPDSLGFVIGELEYTATGPRLAPPGSGTRQLAPSFRQKGTLDGWKNIANFYNRPGMEAQALALFFGFGSPLLKFIGGTAVKGAMVNLMSNSSGSGKTTAQQVINAIFGHPVELLLDKNDTTAARYHHLGMLNNIAPTIDEITNTTDLELSDCAYGISAGRGRHRMEAQSNKMRVNHVTWCSITITSSNSSIVDKLSQLKSTSDGELRRVLEIYVPPCFDYSKEEVDAVFGTLIDNFGTAGPIYIGHIMTIKDSLTTMLKAMQTTIDADLKLTQTDRFHSCILACAFVGGTIARKLGLHNIDVDRVYQYALGVVSKQRKLTAAAAAADPVVIAQETITSYINENINNVLVINSIGRGGVPTAPIREIRGNHLKVRYEPDTQELYVVAADFKRYCHSKQVDVQRSIEALVGANLLKYGGEVRTKRIGAGALSGVPSLPTRCFCFDGVAIGLDAAQFTDPAGD